MNNPTDATGSQEAAEASIPGQWPDGEPPTIREAEAIPNRPSWLAALPCPSWCAWPEDHGERDSYDDRVHTARPVPDIVMTSAAWLDGSGRKDDLPDVVSACLHQHYREREPRIQVEVNERVTGIELTPDEAEAFGDMLLKLAAIARGQAGGEGPVAERSAGPLTAQVWTEPGRVDVFRDERRPDHDRALTPDEAETFGRDLVELAETARVT